MARYYYANIPIGTADPYIFTEMLSTLRPGYKIQRGLSSKLISSSLLKRKCDLQCLTKIGKFFFGGGGGIKKTPHRVYLFIIFIYLFFFLLIFFFFFFEPCL
jgi:hypothetical protein